MRDKAKMEHEELLKKVQALAKTSEEHIDYEQNGALSRFHVVLRLHRGIIKAAGDSNAGHDNTLSQLRLFLKRGTR